MFKVTKTYGHERGLSCAFRQWRAESHCSQLHGYAVAVELVFTCDQLDERNWVIDFGSLSPIKAFLELTFDHTVLVATDDPLITVFKQLNDVGALRLVEMMDGVGCERFAEYVAFTVRNWLASIEELRKRNVRLESCKIMEHGSNAASWHANPAEEYLLDGPTQVKLEIEGNE